MRFGIFGLLFFLLFAGSAFAGTADCVDGTKYYKCSTTQPGLLCNDGKLIAAVSICPCDKDVPGWTQQGTGDDATCVRAKCSDGTDNNKCSITKPKQCANGALADNSATCGCPAGKKPSVNGVTCDFIPCNDSGVSVPEGLCSPKSSGKMCQGGALVDKASSCPCKSGSTKQGESCVVLCEDSTKAGDCSSSKPKECVLSETGVGALIDNAAKCGCPSGMAVDGKRCSTTANVLGGNADLLGGVQPGNSSNQTGATGGASPLSCPCCPAAMIGLLVVGFAVSRKGK